MGFPRMNAIQRVLFCFTTMVTIAYALDSFFGIRNLTSAVIVAVTVWMAFYVRPRRKPVEDGDSST